MPEDGLPFWKLESMASIGEQRRYIIGGTKEEHLVPVQVLEDASDFCRMTHLTRLAPSVSSDQRTAVAALEAALDAHDDAWMRGYADMELGDLVERDPQWAETRSQARRVLAAFRQQVPV